MGFIAMAYTAWSWFQRIQFVRWCVKTFKGKEEKVEEVATEKPKKTPAKASPPIRPPKAKKATGRKTPVIKKK